MQQSSFISETGSVMIPDMPEPPDAFWQPSWYILELLQEFQQNFSSWVWSVRFLQSRESHTGTQAGSLVHYGGFADDHGRTGRHYELHFRPVFIPPNKSTGGECRACCNYLRHYCPVCGNQILEPDIMRKLPFLNVFSFGVAGIMALLIPHPLGIIAAAAYFIGSTFESNAIASTFAGGVEE